MATVEGEDVRCAGCESPVDVRDAVKIVVRQGDRQHWTVLCDDCAVVRCPDCGTSVDVGGVLSSCEAIWTGQDLHECDRCGERAPTSDVAEIRHETNRAYRKLVCSDCLDEVPIPPNMRVIRDVF